MSTPEELKEAEDRFRQVLAADLSKNSSSRWMAILVVVTIVALVVGGGYYYMKRKPKASKTAENDKNATSSKKGKAEATSGDKIVISSE